MKIVEIQQTLAQLGYKPGPPDGIWGRQTAAAVRAFQAKAGLDPDGVIGPITLAALLPGKPDAASNPVTAVWFAEACRLMGAREPPGAGSNPQHPRLSQEPEHPIRRR
jgi:lysozyme family protein